MSTGVEDSDQMGVMNTFGGYLLVLNIYII